MMGMSTAAFTTLHVIISLIGILAGILVYLRGYGIAERVVRVPYPRSYLIFAPGELVKVTGGEPADVA